VAFARWDPLRDLLALHERIERLAAAGDTGWRPPVDLLETADSYVLTAEVPGLARDDIEIQVHDATLLLRGHRPPAQVPCERFHRVERGHGSFARRFTLPTPLAVDQIQADLRDGVLTITIPKAAHAARRHIEVS
jgi:HSP20 family protein